MTPAENPREAMLLVGRFDSHCGACNKECLPHEPAHVTPAGYKQEPGCGALWTHIVSTYGDDASIAATKRLRPDLTYGPPAAGGDGA